MTIRFRATIKTLSRGHMNKVSVTLDAPPDRVEAGSLIIEAEPTEIGAYKIGTEVEVGITPVG